MRGDNDKANKVDRMLAQMFCYSHHSNLTTPAKVLLHLVVASLLTSTQAHAAQSTIAVAANFKAPAKALAKAFAAQNEHRVKLSFGSSGKLYAQIIHGAPYAALLSADQDKALKLEQALKQNAPLNKKLARPRFTYALGKLVLWRNVDQSQAKQNSESLTALLKRQAFNKLALANPKLAPYGLAAQQSLSALGLENATRSKWVLGESVAQSYQFVHVKAADLGFIAASQVAQAKRNFPNSQFWPVPSALHKPIKQDAILLKDEPAAAAFLSYLQSSAGRSLIAEFAYELPELTDSKAPRPSL